MEVEERIIALLVLKESTPISPVAVAERVKTIRKRPPCFPSYGDRSLGRRL